MTSPDPREREEPLMVEIPLARAQQLGRIATAASILLTTANAVMPVSSPYRCPHNRDWLNGVLDDLRAAVKGPSDD